MEMRRVRRVRVARRRWGVVTGSDGEGGMWFWAGFLRLWYGLAYSRTRVGITAACGQVVWVWTKRI